MTVRLDAMLFEACDRSADAIALEDGSQHLRYGELADAARILADTLRMQGLQADEPVLVAVANEPRDIAAFLGVWAAGGVVIPVARDAPVTVAETTRTATGARLWVAGPGEVRLTGHPAPPAREQLAGAALIIFTSGSTGAPKGVVLSHATFGYKLREIDGVLGFSSATRALLVLQITFIFGIWFTLLALLKGGSVFMRQRFDPLAVMTDIAERRITDAAFVPTMLRRIVGTDITLLAPFRNRAGLSRIHTGGEPFNAALGQRIRDLLPKTTIVDIYGLTETSSSDFFAVTEGDQPFSGGIGRCSASETFRIADALGREVPSGEVGELQIHTPFIMNGYLDQPQLTHNAFVGEFFRTGDLARARPDGTTELVGRNKDLIVRAAAKISPLELDGLIAQHPAVAAALTVGIADEVVGERIHVLIVPRTQNALDENDLRSWVAERIERFKRPDVYHFGAELPTGRTGKVDREALRRSLTARNQPAK